MSITSSARQRSWWKRFLRWLKKMLLSPVVFRCCLLALRISEALRHWFNR
jgi:hypothetical protein